MKIDRNYYETQVWDYTDRKGEKFYTFEKVNEQIGSYVDGSGYTTVYFELDTDERIAVITESDNRTSWKRYYNVRFLYGWDGKSKTKKQFVRTLCTRAEYSLALALLLDEYKKAKQTL